MASPGDARENARRKANNHFAAAEARDALVRNELQKERAAFESKTARLKALRLAKEAEDAREEERLALIKAAAKALPQKPAAKKAPAPRKAGPRTTAVKKAAAPPKAAVRAAKKRR